MRGLIVEKRKRKAAVLATNGTVHLVRDEAYTVGQEIFFAVRARRPLAVILCAALLLSLATASVCAAYEPVATVSMEGGGSTVAYTVNRWEQVLTVVDAGPQIGLDKQTRPFEHIDTAIDRTFDAWGDKAAEGNTLITVAAPDRNRAADMKAQIGHHVGENRAGHQKPAVRVVSATQKPTLPAFLESV